MGIFLLGTKEIIMEGGIKQDEYGAKHDDGEAWNLEINEGVSYEGGHNDHPDEEPS